MTISPLATQGGHGIGTGRHLAGLAAGTPINGEAVIRRNQARQRRPGGGAETPGIHTKPLHT
jgi:hypothetical protein